jgi:hypothetical protein
MEKISVEERNEGKSSRTFQNLKGFEETVSGHHQQERTEINLSIMLDIYQLITKDEGRGGRSDDDHRGVQECCRYKLSVSLQFLRRLMPILRILF